MTTAGLLGGELCCTDTTAVIIIDVSSLSFSFLYHDVSVRVHDLEVGSGWRLNTSSFQSSTSKTGKQMKTYQRVEKM